MFKDMKILYKLHPEECKDWRNNRQLLELSKKENVKIVKNGDLYELFYKTEYQAGVYSTSIFGGAESGCKTILFNLPGIEYMNEFIEFYKLKYVGNFYLTE